MVYYPVTDFNYSAQREKPCARSIHLPARSFEHVGGIDGIAGDYRFPDGWKAGEFEAYISKKYFPWLMIHDMDFNGSYRKADFAGALKAEWADLAALNPCLASIPLETGNPQVLFDAILGVTSGFNTDDIAFFTGLEIAGNTPVYAYAQKMTGYAALFNEVAESVARKGWERPIEWVPSPKTLQVMKEKLIAIGKIQPPYKGPAHGS
jgi:hypothetical protein